MWYNPLDEEDNEMSVLFLDLDETLLRTVDFDNAAEIFLGGATWAERKTSKYKEKAGRYYAALRAFDTGDTDELVSWAQRRGVKLMSDFPYATRLRPGLTRFLKAVNEMFDEVNILTTGAREFQKEVIRLHGISDYFDNIYGREDIAAAQEEPPHGTGPLTTSKHSILVDDNGNIGSMGWNSKMSAMGIFSQEDFYSDRDYKEQAKYLERVAEGRFIPIKSWHGADDDTALRGVLDELKELV